MNISRYRIFSNDNVKSKNTEKIVDKKLKKNGFVSSNENYDLGIAIGGDGSFLRMVKETNFNSDILYVGINAGTLGFAQEVSLSSIDDFILELKDSDYKVDHIGVQETKLVTKDSDSCFYSLNEIVVRQKDLNTFISDVYIEEFLLEKFVGDGLLIATSFGSTAYNLSFGGSLVYNTFHTLQITPIAPLNNKSYRNLLNTVVLPENKKVTIVPKNSNDILITIDGENNFYSNVLKIETYVDKKRIKCLRRKDYNFAKKINEKFLN